MPRSRYHHGDLKNAALRASIAELEDHGHVTFTVERVARRLGVTAPAIYRHYTSRNDLLAAVIYTVFLDFVAQMDEAVLAAPSPVEVLRALGRVYVRFAFAHPGWFRLQFSRIARSDHAVRHDDAQMKYPAVVFGALGELHGGDPAMIERMYLLLWTGAHGITSLLLEHVLGHVTTDEARLALADDLLDLLVERVATPPGAAPG